MSSRPLEYLKIKYAAPTEACKCGDCQLVPPGELRAWDDQIQALQMMIKAAYSEGFSEGSREHVTSRGGKPWPESKTREALTKLYAVKRS